MEVSLMIEGQIGLNWPRWKRIIEVVEASGYAGLFRSDHFTLPWGPDDDSLELITSLSYLADHTERIHFGPLVAPVSFRDPVMLTRQIAALGDLSGGRAILGLGAGWQEREHAAFGYDLLPVRERIDRLREGLEVATLLLRGGDPVSFEGTYFRLADAQILPAPGHVPILVGCNGPKRTMPLAARYGDVWNGGAPGPDAFRDNREHLDGLLAAEGRKPGDLKRTLMTGVFFGESDAALDRNLERLRRRPEERDKTKAELVAMLAAAGAVAGGPADVRAQVEAYAAAGVEEIMLQWLNLDDIEGIEALARALDLT